MTNIVKFPLRKEDTPSVDADMSEMVREELSYLSSDQNMIDTVVERMAGFTEILDFDLEAMIEVDDNGVVMDSVIQQIQDLQSRYDEVIANLVSERILHEIQLYHLSKKPLHNL